ncbi:hypothetical protein LMG919_22415, partial [Xanthomonas vesicatoria]
MTAMPEQNPLPFPDGQPAPTTPTAADPGASAAALSSPSAVVTPEAAPAALLATARQAKRPW